MVIPLGGRQQAPSVIFEFEVRPVAMTTAVVSARRFSSNTARPLSCLLLFPNRSLLPLVAIVRFVRDYQDHARSVIVMCIRATTIFFKFLALFQIFFLGDFLLLNSSVVLLRLTPKCTLQLATQTACNWI